MSVSACTCSMAGSPIGNIFKYAISRAVVLLLTRFILKQRRAVSLRQLSLLYVVLT